MPNWRRCIQLPSLKPKCKRTAVTTIPASSAITAITTLAADATPGIGLTVVPPSAITSFSPGASVAAFSASATFTTSTIDFYPTSVFTDIDCH